MSMSKDLLIYTAFTVDALNTLVTFPLFAMNGPKWALQQITNKEDNIPLSGSSIISTTMGIIHGSVRGILWFYCQYFGLYI